MPETPDVGLVGGGAVRPGRRHAVPDRGDELVVAAHPEDRLVLAGEGALGAVLAGRRRADGHGRDRAGGHQPGVALAQPGRQRVRVGVGDDERGGHGEPGRRELGQAERLAAVPGIDDVGQLDELARE